MATDNSSAARTSALDQGPMARISRSRYSDPPGNVAVSGGYIQSASRHATIMTMMSHGTYARAQWLQRTFTSPNRSMAPRAVIDDAPAITILSKIVAWYTRMMNIPRAMLLPLPTPNASARPIAIDAMITTRAMPEGTTIVRRKFEMMRPSSRRG